MIKSVIALREKDCLILQRFKEAFLKERKT